MQMRIDASQNRVRIIPSRLSLQGGTLLRLPPPKSHKIFRPKGQKNFARTDLGWGKTQNAVKPSGLTSILTQPHRKYAEQNRVRICWVRLGERE